MKKLLFIIGLAFLCFSQTSPAKSKFVEGELLVKYKNGAASGAPFALNKKFGAKVIEEFPALKWQRIKLPKGLSVSQAVSRYVSSAEIETAQPNFIYHLQAVPNDTRFSDLYGMIKINAPAAWDLTTGSANTVVAVIDTGIRYTHEDLAANMWRNPNEILNGTDDDGNGFIDDVYGYDFFSNDSDPDDENGHGTHVAGTIGAVGNNSLGVVGVSWNVRMMAIKIYDSTGFGSTSAMLVNAYNYVRMMRQRGVNIRIANNSYGGCDEACDYDQATKDAIDALGNAGVLQVFAAGNNNQNVEATPFYPASYTSPSILSVASSDQNDNRSGFSNFGAISVDLAAPGSGIISTIRNAPHYGGSSGTSMAAPHVSGAAALLVSYNPNLSAQSLKATLMNTVDRLSQWDNLVKTGGRLNVGRALQNQTDCIFTFDKNSQVVFPEGGTFSFNIAAPANCDYSVVSDSNWIIIESGSTGSGDETISFRVPFNSPGLPRVGTISVAGQTFSVTQRPNEISPQRGFMDFNGDGRTDLTAIQNVSGGMLWHIYQSSGLGYKVENFGLFDDDIPVPALYDDDLKNDIAVWRNSTGTFYVLRSQDNTVQFVQFGLSGDNPTVTQDFDGDQKADFAVTRQVDGKLVWYILLSTGGFRVHQFGNATDQPLRGDYDGDGRADLAVYRPASDTPANTFFVLKSSDNSWLVVPFGVSTTDKPIPADFDGDGKTDITVWRMTDGVWHYLKSSDGSYNAFKFGQNGDLPTPGDYDGDGRTDFSVWRPNTSQNESGSFYVYSGLNGFQAFGWGNSTMKIPANILQSR